MRHLELLDILKGYAGLAGLRLDRNCWLTLIDVVELHEPQIITLPNGEWGANCKQCEGHYYPCKTISEVKNGLC